MIALAGAAAASPLSLTMRYGCVMKLWRRLSALSLSSSSSTTCSSYNKTRRRQSRPTCSYSGLQAAYIKNCGLVVESYQMVETDSNCFSSFFPWDDLLREYAKKKRMVEARQIFDIMPERSRVSWHVIILGYIKIGDMSEAKNIFESSPKAGRVWESMICGYARHGMYKLAQKMFERRPDKNILTWQMLDAGHYIDHDEDWKATKTMARDKTTATWNLLIEGNLYFGLHDRARHIFYDMNNASVDRNARSWNLMMAAIVGTLKDYYTLPKMPTMLKENSSHFWNLMISDGWPVEEFDEEFEGANEERFEETLTMFHLHMPEKLQNAASWNALIYVHILSGKLDESRFYFDNMPPEIRNPHSWGLMMTAYLEKGMFDEAKEIFFDKNIRDSSKKKDKNIRVCDDLHSWILMLRWFVNKKKKMVDEATRFLVDNVPKRPLSYYSIASSCIKHGFRQGARLVLETMQATMHTNLNIHETITFLEEKLKENRPPDDIIYFSISSGRAKRKKSDEKEDEKPREVVHVRARRGQATDSHSLAERVRRGKINERLKCLQDIVPGCYKTMGMAMMLDEIINYVQSLQNQVEFLSMKLNAASSFYDFNSESDTIDTQRAMAVETKEMEIWMRTQLPTWHP